MIKETKAKPQSTPHKLLDEQLQCIAELADRSIASTHDRARLERRLSEVRETRAAQTTLCAVEVKA